MFRAVCLTIVLSTVTYGPRVVTDGHKQNVSLQSSQLGDGHIQMNTTQVSFHNKKSDDHTKSSLHSQITLLPPLSNNEESEMAVHSSSDHKNSFRSNKNITNGYGKQPFQEHTAGMKESIVGLRWPRDAENISSSQLARLAVTLKTAEMENKKLKAKVKELQGTAEKLTTRLLEVEAKSSVMMEATAAQQQQQMTTGQLQLQISQLSTNMMKLQEENEALRRQLQNISEMTSAKSTKLQDETQALRTLLQSLSQEANLTQTQLQNISEVTAGLQAENRSIYAQVRTLTNENMAQHTQAKAWHTTLLQKVGALQVQASLLDSKLRVHGDELTTVNRSLRTQNTELEYRLNLQTSQLRKGDQDLLEKVMNYTAAEVVGFHARLATHTDTRSGGTLVVDRVEYNSGGGYNPNTGVFTAPVTGLYLFLLNMASENNVGLRIVLDNIELCRTLSQYSKTYEMASCHAAAKAVKGEKVWVKTSDGLVTGFAWTTFTGVLIQREY